MSTTPEKKKSSGAGCFVVGCLSLIVVFIVAIVVLFFGTRYYIRSSIEKFTEATPAQFEAAELPEAEAEALRERLEGFARAVQDTNQTAQITLDSREMNSLIVSEPKLSKLKDTVRLQVEGDEVQCRISVPLDPLAEIPFLGGLKGRFLNATARMQVSFADGVLTTRLTGANVKGQELPAEALAEIEKNMPWQELQNSPEMRELLSKIDWLNIEEGRVRFGTGEATP